MALYGEVIDRALLDEEDINTMFCLMNEFYDNVSMKVFQEDLSEKDHCILLKDETGDIKGFSTQKIMCVDIGQKKVWGVFSGDTIIHRDYWGSLELFKVFAQYYVRYGENYDSFYWFLISKGYKTYKMLPLFFKDFYPRFDKETPEFELAVMKAFGNKKYPLEYDAKRGVIVYGGKRDKLKEGVADILEKQLKDKNIEFFTRINPGYVDGDDLVCLAKLSRDNFNQTAQRLFLRK